jgi:hypothetical protein
MHQYNQCTTMSATAVSPLSDLDRQHVAAVASKLGRFGLAARGAVYVVLGVLAAKAAFGHRGAVTDQQGAVQTIAHSPAGHIMLWVVGLGLVGFIVWRLAQAFLDIEHHGTDRKGLLKRTAAFISGVAYIGISSTALSIAAGRSGAKGGAAGDQQAQDHTAWLMEQPFGRWLVGAVAVIIAGVALYQFYQAITAKFADKLRGGGLTADQETWVRRAGRWGHAARGVAFAVISWFIFQAAMDANAAEAGGMASALQTIAQQPQGKWLLAITGVGLALFGAYSLAEARYRRFS